MYFICMQTYKIMLIIAGKKMPASCIIIYYHSIRKDEIPSFARQLDCILKYTTPIPIGYDGSLKNGIRYSIITFDDAFQSVVDNAAQELLKRKIQFTIFIPAGQLGKKPSWLCDTGDRDEDETVATIDQLLKLPSGYVSFGSHTVNHPRLTSLNDNDAYKEIKLSKDMLETYFNHPIKFLAIPYGACDQRIIDLCKTAGYEKIFTINNESPYRPFINFEKGRVGVNPEDWLIEFKLKIMGAYSWMPLASSIKKDVLKSLNIRST